MLLDEQIYAAGTKSPGLSLVWKLLMDLPRNLNVVLVPGLSWRLDSRSGLGWFPSVSSWLCVLRLTLLSVVAGR